MLYNVIAWDYLSTQKRERRLYIMAKLYDEYQEYGDTEPTVEYSDEEETPRRKIKKNRIMTTVKTKANGEAELLRSGLVFV